ncbi:tRNA pseudouridine synthase A [uncultured Spirochaetota bacterium]|jgi:tRNA pseudouridine38-40 synthase|uniref:tRNA pseudouridine synthase A n=1 Tax=uncultured Spirochaetota bacterium TaxID=460511 RepID=A0A652ZZI5_9SPIR|nr:tRNA pseudouridine synthase A [uncultured Spirochaetota bacterium]
MSTKAVQLVVAYDGTDFGGWQRQKNARSVQEELEKALQTIHGHPVKLTGAGRTDAGVHALGQVAGFFSDIPTIPVERFKVALNSLLPKDIRVMGASPAPGDFHARFDASLRRYRYFVLCGSRQDPFRNRYAWCISRQPALAKLNAMAEVLVGEHDFSAFASAGDSSLSRSRFVQESYFWYEGESLVYQVAANAFLWRMVRSLVGTMLFFEAKTSSQAEASDLMRGILEGGDRKKAGPTAPPEGLFLWNVEYGARLHGHRRRKGQERGDTMAADEVS